MKKILSLFVVMSVILFNGFMLFEGSTAGAATATYDWDVTVTAESSFTCGHNTSTSKLNFSSISGLTGGTSEAVTYCLVVTNNVAGWDLYINDRGGHAGTMVSPSSSIAAYTPASPGVPETWVLSSSSTSEYGYYASSTHPVAGYAINLYRDLTNATVAVAGNNAATTIAGERTDFGFKVQLGAAANQPSGVYVSEVRATLIER
jgi:hypothetical protein